MDNHWTSKWRLQPVRRCCKGSQLARVVPALRNNKMKITKLELRNIIKEELEAVLNEADPMARMYGGQKPQAPAKSPAAPAAAAPQKEYPPECAEVRAEAKKIRDSADDEMRMDYTGAGYGMQAQAMADKLIADLVKKHPKCFGK